MSGALAAVSAGARAVLPTLAAVATVPHGPEIGRRAAQRLARQELSEASLPQRILEWILRLFSTAAHSVSGGWSGLIALGVLAVLAVTVTLFLVRPAAGRRAAPDPVLAGRARTAGEHRREAERLAGAGEYGSAIVEGARAIAVELDQRGILPPRPGRTADELAAEAGLEIPALAADLRAVARLFDDVRYGDREGTRAGFQFVSRVDADVRSARVTGRAGPQAAGAGFGAPR